MGLCTNLGPCCFSQDLLTVRDVLRLAGVPRSLCMIRLVYLRENLLNTCNSPGSPVTSVVYSQTYILFWPPPCCLARPVQGHRCKLNNRCQPLECGQRKQVRVSDRTDPKTNNRCQHRLRSGTGQLPALYYINSLCEIYLSDHTVKSHLTLANSLKYRFSLSFKARTNK